LHLWDVASGKQVTEFGSSLGGGEDNPVHQTEQPKRAVAFAPDGRSAVSTTSVRGEIKLWQLPGGSEITGRAWQLGFVSRDWGYADRSISVRSIAFLPDGHTVLSTDNNQIHCSELASGRRLRTFFGYDLDSRAFAVAPDGRSALSAGQDRLTLWDVPSGYAIKTFIDHHVYSRGDYTFVTTVALSPDGRTALSANNEENIKVWDLATGLQTGTFNAPSAGTLSLAFSPDGHRVLSASFNNTVTLWDLSRGEVLKVLTGHSGPVAWSGDGRTALLSSPEGAIALWDIESWREIKTFTGNSAHVNALVFGPNDRIALSGGSDGTITLWDIENGREIRTFAGPAAGVLSVAFSPDGRFVLSGNTDGSMRLWNLATGELLASVMSYSENTWLTITPEGFYDASSPGTLDGFSVIRGLAICPIEPVTRALYRPDLVAEKIAGDPNGKVKAAAAQIDLDKLCLAPDPDLDRPGRPSGRAAGRHGDPGPQTEPGPQGESGRQGDSAQKGEPGHVP